MDSIFVQKAGQIASPAREWLQNLFGRTLGEDEHVTIFVATPHAAPAAEDRRAAFERMNKVLDEAAKRMKDVSDEDFNEAVDDAFEDIRRRRK
ncbi:MAG: hypothetical protein GTO53_13365 [Planctomycetales bacterium]|nr:hypothetical protein [Planctomycetales bacterium]NIM10084.1 hypothetical protein [Planctomycetales bacterium]NIN09527.1 hypothetical protein [Planctomycetales bacterium]NIN78637.1 hypothetical protein [Planctomycetales bacterium]NIO35831.1 hypothetical protein [Planctomycetales bacterium]